MEPVGRKNELLVDLLTKAKASDYLSGIGARDYYQAEPFEVAKIAVHWQDLCHPVYPQQFEGFISYLSGVDLFFNCGAEQARQMLRKC
jgi:hypothetical protein